VVCGECAERAGITGLREIRETGKSDGHAFLKFFSPFNFSFAKLKANVCASYFFVCKTYESVMWVHVPKWVWWEFSGTLAAAVRFDEHNQEIFDFHLIQYNTILNVGLLSLEWFRAVSGVVEIRSINMLCCTIQVMIISSSVNVKHYCHYLTLSCQTTLNVVMQAPLEVLSK
jgi:hypothetical protein